MSDIGISTLGSNPVDTGFQSEALANLDKDTFLQLLVAQMQYQNPLSPVDSQEYLAQAAQYASVEQLENMAESQAELKSMQMVSIATDLVGKDVTAFDSFTGGEITGRVEAVRFGTEPILIVDGAEVPLTAVIDVRDTPARPDVDTGGDSEAVDPAETEIDTAGEAEVSPDAATDDDSGPDAASEAGDGAAEAG